MTTYALLVAYGYQIDLLEKNIKKTSIIDISATLEDVSIMINGEIRATTGPTKIKNIDPGVYHLTITKEGFTTWQKDIKVPEDFVAKVHDILLIPENFEELSSKIELDFVFAEVLYNYNSLLFISPLENEMNLYRLNSEGKFDIEKINFQMNNKKYDHVYFVGGNHVAFSNSGQIFLLDLEDKSMQTIIIPDEFSDFKLAFAPDLKGFYRNGDNLYVTNIAEDGTFYKITLLYESLIGNEANDMKLIDSQGRIFVLEGDYLFYFADDQLFYIDNNVKVIPNVSPDGGQVVYIRDGGEIILYDFYDHSKEFLARFANSINSVNWYADGQHLFIEKQATLELCDLSFENCNKLVSIEEEGKFIYLPNQKYFTIVDNESISLSFLSGGVDMI
jgi:hypothetical protein